MNVRKTEELLHSKLLNVVPALITIYNVETLQYTYINDAVERFLGYSKQHLQRGGLEFAASLIHPDDLAHVVQLHEREIDQANAKPSMDSSDKVIISEYRIRHLNRTWRWIQTQGTIFDRDEQGKVKHLMNISVDISERKISEEWTKHALNDEINYRKINEDKLAKAKALAENAQQISAANEEKYLAFIRNSNEGIWRFELDVPLPTSWPVRKQIDHLFKHAYLAEANHAMAHMYGVKSPEDIIGTRLNKLLLPNDPQNLRYLEAFIQSDYRLSGVESHEKGIHGNDKYFRNSLVGYVHDKHLLRAWGTQQDITEQHKASSNLMQSEERLALTIRASQMGTWEWDLKTNELTWSDELRKIYGIPKKLKLTFESIQKYNHPDDNAHVNKIIQQAAKDGSAFKMTYRIVRPKGDIRWVAAYGKAYLEEGSAARMYGTVVDINDTKRKEEDISAAREKISLSEKRLNLALTAAKVGIWEWDITTNELIWSDQLKKLYGLKSSDSVYYDSYQRQLPLKDRKRMQKVITAALRTGRSYKIEHQIIWPDGSIHWVLGQGKAIIKNGKPVRMLGTSMSIDDRREFERTMQLQLQLHRSVSELGQMALTNIPLRQLLDEAVQHITNRLGVEYGKVFEILPEAKTMILRAAAGWSKDIVVDHAVIPIDRNSQSGYTAITNRPVIVKDFSTEKRVARPSLFAHNKVMSGITVIIQGPEGPYGVLAAHSTQKRDFTKDDISYLQSVANIIGLVIKQQALSLRSQELEAINAVKDEFISVASHHLRTPASAVKMYLGLLQEGYAGDLSVDQKEYIDQAYDSNEQQLQVIEDLLNVAEVDTMQVNIRPRREDLTKIIEEVLASLAGKFTARQQQVSFKNTDKPCYIFADVVKIRIVLENIIGNASKYSPEGKSIHIKIRQSAKNVILDISDEGKGIERADLDRIFDKFARIKNEAYISESGTGLGLYWAKKIVELHSGSITVKSKIGRGSTFSIKLPATD